MGKFTSVKYQTCTKLLVIIINYAGCFFSPNCLLISPHIHRFPFHWRSNYSNRLWPSAVCQPGKSTPSYSRLSLQMASIEATMAWWICTHSKRHFSGLFSASNSCDPARSRPQFCQGILPHLGRPAVEGRLGLMYANAWKGNALWSLQAEMDFKWSTRQWFVILLIRFGGDTLPLCTEKG